VPRKTPYSPLVPYWRATFSTFHRKGSETTRQMTGTKKSPLSSQTSITAGQPLTPSQTHNPLVTTRLGTSEGSGIPVPIQRHSGAPALPGNSTKTRVLVEELGSEGQQLQVIVKPVCGTCLCFASTTRRFLVERGSGAVVDDQIWVNRPVSVGKIEAFVSLQCLGTFDAIGCIRDPRTTVPPRSNRYIQAPADLRDDRPLVCHVNEQN